MNLNYDKLHHLQVGRIGEYWVKLILTSYGFDTYYCDVDHKAIDFVVRLDNSKHIDIQVKTVRLKSSTYLFITKGDEDDKTWSNVDICRDNLYLGLVVLTEDQYPEVFLIPSSAWIDITDNATFKDRLYPDLKSKPEWGMSLNRKHLHLLDQYKIDKQIEQWKNSQDTYIWG
jgi:hypothetical protein